MTMTKAEITTGICRLTRAIASLRKTLAANSFFRPFTRFYLSLSSPILS